MFFVIKKYLTKSLLSSLNQFGKNAVKESRKIDVYHNFDLGRISSIRAAVVISITLLKIDSLKAHFWT